MASVQCDPRGKDKSELKNSESFQETFECSVCKIILNSFRNVQTHSTSLEHVQKVIAENSENSESLEVFRRINHFSKFEDSSRNENVHNGVNANILPRMKNVKPEENSAVDLNNTRFSCGFSEKYKSGQIPFMQHMESEIRKEKKIDTEAKNYNILSDCDLEDLECNTRGIDKEYNDEDFREFHCIVCNEDIVGYHSYLCHSKSSVHAKKLEKYKLKAQMKGMHYINEEYDNKDLRVFHCIVCKEDSVGYHSYLCHSRGSNHAKNLDKYKRKAQMKGMRYINEEYDNKDLRVFHCIVCKEDSVGYHSYLRHSKGSVHAKNLEKYKLKAQLKDLTEVPEKDRKGNRSDNHDCLVKSHARCDTCEKIFSRSGPSRIHMKSAAHNKKEKSSQAELGDELTQKTDGDDFFSECNVCQKTFNGYTPFKIHMLSREHHKKAVEKIAEEMKQFCLNEDTTEVYTYKGYKKNLDQSDGIQVATEEQKPRKAEMKGKAQ